MGLETFASRSPDDIELSPEDSQAFLDPDIHLAGGIFSRGNDGSFRGKIYQVIIKEITGASLLQDWIPPVTVREMYAALMACDPRKVFRENYWHRCMPEDIMDLHKFFRVCSERMLGLLN